jgi:hypothetical protein
MTTITFKINTYNPETKNIEVSFLESNVAVLTKELHLGSILFSTLDELYTGIANIGRNELYSKPHIIDDNIMQGLKIGESISFEAAQLAPVPIDQIKIKIREVLLAEGIIK